MKNYTLLIAGILLTLSSFAQIDPFEFNTSIIAERVKVDATNLEYVSFSVHSEDYRAVAKKRKTVIKQIKSSIKTIKSLPVPKNGKRLKSEALAVLKMYDNIFNLDFKEIEELKKGSKNSYNSMEQYFKAQDKAEKKLDRAADRFEKAQLSFAKKNNWEFEDSGEETPLNLQIKKMNEANEYSRNIFLIYFKADKAHAIFMEAVSKESKSMEGKRKKMESAAQEALTNLKAIQGFEGDTKYRDAGIKLMDFYLEMASDDFKDVVYVNKTKQKNLTQKDVDAFNAAIEKYNKNVNNYLMEFNAANSELLQKHTPKFGIEDKKVKRT